MAMDIHVTKTAEPPFWWNEITNVQIVSIGPVVTALRADCTWRTDGISVQHQTGSGFFIPWHIITRVDGS